MGYETGKFDHNRSIINNARVGQSCLFNEICRDCQYRIKLNNLTY